MKPAFEIALVARVGSQRVPVILASVFDDEMLHDVLRRVIVIAERQTRTASKTTLLDLLAEPGGAVM